MPHSSTVVNRVFDRLKSIWEDERVRRNVAFLLVPAFPVVWLAIELQRQEWLPQFSQNHDLFP